MMKKFCDDVDILSARWHEYKIEKRTGSYSIIVNRNTQKKIGIFLKAVFPTGRKIDLLL
jgi:hypothetical protein